MKKTVKTVEMLAAEVGTYDGITTELNNYVEGGAVCVNVRIYYKGGCKGLAEDLADGLKSDLEMIGFDGVEIVRLMPRDNFVTVSATALVGNGCEVRKDYESNPVEEWYVDRCYINGNRVCDLAA